MRIRLLIKGNLADSFRVGESNAQILASSFPHLSELHYRSEASEIQRCLVRGAVARLR